MQKRRISWLPDFAKGKAAIAIAIVGVCWTIMAIHFKEHWFMVLIGIFIAVKGTLRAIENAKAPKQKKVGAFKAMKEQREAYKQYCRGAENKDNGDE